MKSDHKITTLLQQSRFEAAFNELVSAYTQPLYHHIRTLVKNHDDTDDILQNTFIKVWKGLPTYRNEATIYTWIYRIATNETYTFLRRTKRLDSLDLVASRFNQGAEDALSANEIQEHFEKALSTLPPKQALVFKMKYFDALSYETMSTILGTSVGALKASYFHAAKKLKRFLEDH